MTKQEEIREEIASYVYACFSTWKEKRFFELSELNKQGWLEYADNILKKLDAQGVGIKVDYYVSGTEVNCPNCHCVFLDKVEPLIK